jgi:hypothetical protein
MNMFCDWLRSHGRRNGTPQARLDQRHAGGGGLQSRVIDKRGRLEVVEGIGRRADFDVMLCQQHIGGGERVLLSARRPD